MGREGKLEIDDQIYDKYQNYFISELRCDAHNVSIAL
jgi:hypothetical protein